MFSLYRCDKVLTASEAEDVLSRNAKYFLEDKVLFLLCFTEIINQI